MEKRKVLRKKRRINLGIRRSIATFLTIVMLSAASMSAVAFAVGADDYDGVVATEEAVVYTPAVEAPEVEAAPEVEPAAPEVEVADEPATDEGEPADEPADAPEAGEAKDEADAYEYEDYYSRANPLDNPCLWCYEGCDCHPYCDCEYYILPAYFNIVATSFRGSLEAFVMGTAPLQGSETFNNVDATLFTRWTPESFESFLMTNAPAFMAAPASNYYSGGALADFRWDEATETMYLYVLHLPAGELWAWVDFYRADASGSPGTPVSESSFEMLEGLSYWTNGARTVITVEMIEDQLEFGLNQHRPAGYSPGVLYDVGVEVAANGTAIVRVVYSPPVGVQQQPPVSTPDDGDDSDDVDGGAPANDRRPATGPQTGDANNSFAQIAALAVLVVTLVGAGLLRTREQS